MKKTNIEYMKNAVLAFKKYTSNSENIDYQLVNNIYNYIENIKSLTKNEYKELDDFIKSMLYKEDRIHIANILLEKNEKNTLKKQLNYMKPFQIVKKSPKIRHIVAKTNELAKPLTIEKPIKFSKKVLVKKVA